MKQTLPYLVIGIGWFGIAALWGIREYNERKTKKEYAEMFETHLTMLEKKRMLEKMYTDLQKSL